MGASGDSTLCGLALEAEQEDGLGDVKVISTGAGFCGQASTHLGGQPFPPPTDPTCLALGRCCSMLAGAEADTCHLVEAEDHGQACGSTVAYLMSRGSCASLHVDAGTWAGLLPIVWGVDAGSMGSAGGSVSR